MVYKYSLVFELFTELKENELNHLRHQAQDLDYDSDSSLYGKPSQTSSSTDIDLQITKRPIDFWAKAAIRINSLFLEFDQASPERKQQLLDSLANKEKEANCRNNLYLLKHQQLAQQSKIPNPEQHISVDWRFGDIEISGVDMSSINNSSEHTSSHGDSSSTAQTSNERPHHGQNRTYSSSADSRPDLLKARFMGYGVIRLYRNDTESGDLYIDPVTEELSKNEEKAQEEKTNKQNESAITDSSQQQEEEEEEDSKKDDDPLQGERNTTLAILAVPSYLTPPDFLGFIGANARENTSHLRMVKNAAQTNRYMVLMKFRTSLAASIFYNEYNGKLFNSMDEAETCQVVYVDRIEFKRGNSKSSKSGKKVATTTTQQHQEIPYLLEDPFTLDAIDDENDGEDDGNEKEEEKKEVLTQSGKPAPPPTPVLMELPTCPVCLERMDAVITGLLTIPCQHTFHCQCLSKWKDGSCPVCRYSQRTTTKKQLGHCSVCNTRDNLWICLICGHIGCGRYDKAHAFDHFEVTGHCYAMDMESQRVWDYLSDSYVHRLLQNQADGKLVEIPAGPAHDNTPIAGGSSTGHFNSNTSSSSSSRGGGSALYNSISPKDKYYYGRQQQQYGPPLSETKEITNAAFEAADASEKKLNEMSVHFTQMLTSQLESQRYYYESLVAAAADKSHELAQRLQTAEETAARLSQELDTLKQQQQQHGRHSHPDTAEAIKKYKLKAAELAAQLGRMTKSYNEERLISQKTLEKVQRLETEAKARDEEMQELKEQVRDLMFFHEAQAAFADAGEDVQQGKIIVPEKKQVPSSSSSSKNTKKGNKKR